MNQTEYLSSGDAAGVLGIKVEAFRMRWKRGALPFSPVGVAGGNYLWNRREVERYAALTRAS